MSISILGIIVISLILLLFVTQRNFYVFIDKILVLFVIVSQIQVGYLILFKSMNIPIITSYFFSLLFIGVIIVSISLKDVKISLPYKPSRYLFLFFLTCLISTVVLIFKPPDILVLPINDEGSVGLIPASFSLVQPLELIRFLTYCIIFLMFYNFPKKESSRNNLIKIFLIVTIIHSMCGLLEKYILFPLIGSTHREILADLTGRYIYSYSFITPPRAGSYTIHGFASEPSNFVMIVSLGASIVTYCLYYGEKIFKNRFYDIVSFIILISVLILSGSTTGAITVLTSFVLLGIIVLIKKRSLKLAFGALALLVLLVFLFRGYFIYQWEKIQLEMSYTMLGSRFMTMKYAIEAFKASPLIGVGFGTSNSFSSLTVLLANTGVIGTVFYFLFYFSVIIRLFKRNTPILFQAIGFSLMVYFIVGIFSGGFHQILNPLVWMLLGMAAKGYNHR